MCMCVSVFLCLSAILHLRVFVHLHYAPLCACVFVRDNIARLGSKPAAERKKHKRHRVKLDLTVSIGAGGKFDCSLQVVWGFDITGALSLTIHQTKLALQKWTNVKWGQEGGVTELDLGSDPTAPTSVPVSVPCDRMSALFKCKSSPPAFWYKHMNLKSG